MPDYNNTLNGSLADNATGQGLNLKFPTGIMAAGAGGVDSYGTPYTNYYTGVTGIRSDGTNFMFNDGHVKFLRPIQVSSRHNGISGDDQQTATAGSGQGLYKTAATDTLFLDSAHTQSVVGTFSAN